MKTELLPDLQKFIQYVVKNYRSTKRGYMHRGDFYNNHKPKNLDALAAEYCKELDGQCATESIKEDHCHAHNDGDCFWDKCPQLENNEPSLTGRSCPLKQIDRN